MFRAVIVVVLAAFVAPAAAQELPHYDVEAHCARLAEATSGGEFMRNACLSQEQRSYDQVKGEWAGLPEARRLHCDHMASATMGGYFMLAACLEQERRAGEQNERFTFQR